MSWSPAVSRNCLPAFALAIALGFAAPVAAQNAGSECATIAASYKKLVAADPDVASRKSFYPESPLTVLAGTSDSGISVAPHVAEAGKKPTPLEWAQQQGLWHFLPSCRTSSAKAIFWTGCRARIFMRRAASEAPPPAMTAPLSR